MYRVLQVSLEIQGSRPEKSLIIGLCFADFESCSCFQQNPSQRQWHHTSAPPQQQSAQSGVIETFTDNLQGNDN
jgi:hypothetical protein